MSYTEFKYRTQGKVIKGLVILITEPINSDTSKVLAMTLNGKAYVVGKCDHKSENVVMSDVSSYPEHNKAEAIQKFISIM